MRTTQKEAHVLAREFSFSHALGRNPRRFDPYGRLRPPLGLAAVPREHGPRAGACKVLGSASWEDQ